MGAVGAEGELARVSAPVAVATVGFPEGVGRALEELAPAAVGRVRRVKAGACGKAAEEVPVREAV